jgi:capsular exopolysaccharide synthesis family protein
MSHTNTSLEPLARDSEDAYFWHHMNGAMPDPFASSDEPPAPDITEYWNTFKKRGLFIGLCTACCAASALLYCLFTSPTYTASATIELRGYEPLLSTIQSENLFVTDSRKIEYQKTTVAKLKLAGLADQVLSQNGLATELQEYFGTPRHTFLHRLATALPAFDKSSDEGDEHDTGFHFVHSPDAIRKYLALIDIAPVYETNLVYINASTSDPFLSHKLANSHALQFIEHLRRERQDAITANAKLLRAQAADLKQKVTDSENQLASYASQNKLLMLRDTDNSNANTRHIESLAQMIADATGRRIRAESSFTEAKLKSETDSSVSDTEVTKELRVSLKQAETEYATLGSQVTTEYPTMRELHAKIASLKKAIQDERRRALISLQSQYETERNTEQNLRQQIEQEKSKAQEVARQLIQYNVLSKEASSLRELYQAVLKQAQEIEISASAATPSVFVADYASLPTAPSAPKTGIIVSIFTFIGFAVGIIAAFLRETIEDKISSTESAQHALNLPLLGTVPEFHRRLLPGKQTETGTLALEGPAPAPDPTDTTNTAPQTPSDSTQIIAAESPHSAISEALRTIRANLLLSSADYPPRIVAISSAIQGEGKTTILANLAVTLAQAKHRTLIIDGDLRLAGLSKLFQSSSQTHPLGLTDFITGQSSLEESITPTMVPHLDILPAGSKAPNPAELVGSASMKRLLSVLRERYDFILIDTPPIMAVADALLLSRLVDSVLLVVRHGFTARSVAREARLKLGRVKARVLGVIVNDMPESSLRDGAMLYGANYLQFANEQEEPQA